MPMSSSQWLLLLLLALLWGCSFFFNAIILTALPPATLVLSRVMIAAIVLASLARMMGLAWPRSLEAWLPFAVMSIFNNVLPFMLITRGQQEITTGVASVINATTPLWSVVLAHYLTPGERITAPRVVGVACGIAGVAVLFGPELEAGRSATIAGMLLVLAGALSYACAGIWGRRLGATPPILAAACQLISSSLIMAPVVLLIDQPWQLSMPGPGVWAAIAGLALMSTALAYVVFYRILAVSGGTNVMLVTLIIPVVAILLGVLALGETFHSRYAIGAAMIAAALVIIDGRLVARLGNSSRGEKH